MSLTPGKDAGAPGPPRMLRIEFKGQPYDWFNLDEMGDIVRTSDFSSTLRENITHYFGVPFEYQAIYDEEGLLVSMIDFSRALRSVRPWLRVYDAREMVPDLKEITTKQLEEIATAVVRSQRNLSSWGGPVSSNGAGAADLSVASSGPAKAFASPQQNGWSPANGQRDPALSFSDAVKSANEPVSSGVGYNSNFDGLGGSARAPINKYATDINLPFANGGASQYATGGASQYAAGGASQFRAPNVSSPSTAFPWRSTMEAYSPPQMPRSDLRFPTPPPMQGTNFHSLASQIPGVTPSLAPTSGVSAWGSRTPPYGTSVVPPSMGQAQWQSSMPPTWGQHQPMGMNGPAAPLNQLNINSWPQSQAPPLNTGLPPASRSAASSTPPMPLATRDIQLPTQQPPQEVFRQTPPVGNALGGAAGAGGASVPQAANAPGNLTPPMELRAATLPAANLGGSAAPAALAPAASMGKPAETSGFSSRPNSARDMATRDIQVGSAPAANPASVVTQPQDIEVKLVKEAGFERFGFANVPTRDNRALQISWVDSSGLLQMKWNSLVDMQRQVMEGDIIVAVNGQRGEVEAMRKQLQNDSVQLTIQRSSK